MKEIIADLKRMKEDIELTKHKYIFSLIIIFVIFVSVITYLTISDIKITGNAVAQSNFSSYSYFGILFIAGVGLIYLIIKKGFQNKEEVKAENKGSIKDDVKEELDKIKRKFEEIEMELIGMLHNKK